MLGFIIRLILFALMIWTGVMWVSTGAFLWWGLVCVILIIVFFASLGLDGSDVVWYID